MSCLRPALCLWLFLWSPKRQMAFRIRVTIILKHAGFWLIPAAASCIRFSSWPRTLTNIKDSPQIPANHWSFWFRIERFDGCTMTMQTEISANVSIRPLHVGRGPRHFGGCCVQFFDGAGRVSLVRFWTLHWKTKSCIEGKNRDALWNLFPIHNLRAAQHCKCSAAKSNVGLHFTNN